MQDIEIKNKLFLKIEGAILNQGRFSNPSNKYEEKYNRKMITMTANDRTIPKDIINFIIQENEQK